MEDLPSGKHLEFATKNQEYDLTLRIGYKPSWPIGIHSEDRIYQGDQTPLTFSLHNTLDDTPYNGCLISEVMCSKEMPLTDSARRYHEPSLVRGCDFMAAFSGLTIGPEFFSRLIYEDILVTFSNEPDKKALQAGRSIYIRKRLALSVSEIEARVFNDWKLGEGISRAFVNTPAMDWLVKSWAEEDPVIKFVALFIPLEIALSGVRGDKWLSDDVVKQIKSALINSDDVNKNILVESLEVLVKNQKSPSLASRFEAVARIANPEGWQNDFEAFKKFNGMRNALVHRGDKNIRPEVTVRQEEVVDFQDLVQRYVFWTLFNVDKVS